MLINNSLGATIVQIGSHSTLEDLCVARIARFLGLNLLNVRDVAEAAREFELSRPSQSAVATLILNTATLVDILSRPESAECRNFLKLRSSASILVYGFPNDSEESRVLGAFFEFSPEAKLNSIGSGKREYRFAADNGSSPLAGLSFTREEDKACRVLNDPSLLNKSVALISVNGHPLLVARGNGNHVDLLLTTAADVDLDRQCLPSERSSAFYTGLLPTAFALRRLFGAACWHNPHPTGCVIIDDPLLHPRYGFFEYTKIISELETNKYSLTVAFIPCNFKRSNPGVVKQVIQNADKFSICVHGCYHTEAEFGALEQAAIENTAKNAMDFMQRHQSVTTLPFDRAMVFPQGAFSRASLPALCNCGYLAAVNTGAHAIDHANAPITVSDLFGPAQLRYGDIPLFSRRYPVDPFDFAVDLFWGKPVLIVEHHDYFRNGVGPLSAFVQKVNSLGQRIDWQPLGRALSEAALYRKTGPQAYDVRFVTARFHLRNPLEEHCVFRCWKQERDRERVADFSVDGKSSDYQWDNGGLSVVIELEARGSRMLQVVYRPRETTYDEPSISYKMRAVARRRLSEIRDNYLSGNKSILKLLRRLKTALLGSV